MRFPIMVGDVVAPPSNDMVLPASSNFLGEVLCSILVARPTYRVSDTCAQNKSDPTRWFG
jgi:hypothetical protein